MAENNNIKINLKMIHLVLAIVVALIVIGGAVFAGINSHPTIVTLKGEVGTLKTEQTSYQEKTDKWMEKIDGKLEKLTEEIRNHNRNERR